MLLHGLILMALPDLEWTDKIVSDNFFLPYFYILSAKATFYRPWWKWIVEITLHNTENSWYDLESENWFWKRIFVPDRLSHT